ncbi:MAG: DNA-3-methyladenine glycosylase 2 family protein [Acidobacteria bacterium]|nr:MAG: DNA-3-methyladenine glycosylase 2 family protein [Acidobacteriota bacterium]
MGLDPDICYRASVSRDPRFDGRFFMGVTSTGIYCRPICPARQPRRANCRYFRHAATAEAAGFRPCLRCRPESAPGTPAWSGSHATVSRALRLIQQRALANAGVDELATRLGVGTRHLRRLLNEHVGVSPLAIEQTRRLLFAKKLITETSLSMAQVARNAGFGSVRRFNTVFRAAYDLTPGNLRRGPRRSVRAAGLTLSLAFRPPFHWQALVSFLAQRAIPGLEEIGPDFYRRRVAYPGAAGTVEVRPVPGARHLHLTIPDQLAPHIGAVVQRVRNMFDLDADPLRIADVLNRDKRLRPLVRKRPGLRIPGCWDPFELAVRAILGQQITVRGATTLATRLVDQFGRQPAGGPSETPGRLFPTAAKLARADLTAIGLPRVRAATISGLAQAVSRKSLDLNVSEGLDETVARLCALPGFGEWTAHYIAMRAFCEPDAFPATDLGLRKALADGKELPRPRHVIAMAESWRPWRAYATMHLWSQS